MRRSWQGSQNHRSKNPICQNRLTFGCVFKTRLPHSIQCVIIIFPKNYKLHKIAILSIFIGGRPHFQSHFAKQWRCMYIQCLGKGELLTARCWLWTPWQSSQRQIDGSCLWVIHMYLYCIHIYIYTQLINIHIYICNYMYTHIWVIQCYIYIFILWVIDIFTKHLPLQLDESAVIGSPSQRHDQKPQSAESMLLRSKESGVPPRHLEMDRNLWNDQAWNEHPPSCCFRVPKVPGFWPITTSDTDPGRDENWWDSVISSLGHWFADVVCQFVSQAQHAGERKHCAHGFRPQNGDRTGVHTKTIKDHWECWLWSCGDQHHTSC